MRFWGFWGRRATLRKELKSFQKVSENKWKFPYVGGGGISGLLRGKIKMSWNCLKINLKV